MIRERDLFAVLLAGLTVVSVATLGGAALGESATPTEDRLRTGPSGGMQFLLANASENRSDGWPSPRADAGRTGATSDDGPLPHANTSWEASSSGRDPWGPAVTGDSVVMAYTGEDRPNGVVESYDAATGETEWRQENLGDPVGPATTANDTVFVATLSDNLGEFIGAENRTGLYALNASTGETEWRVNATFGPPVVADGRLFASERPSDLDHGDGYGNVTAVDPSTGERVWTSNVRGKVLAYADGRLVVGDERSDTLYALDAEDGSLRWRTGVEESAYLEDRVAATGETVYVTNGTDPYPIENVPKAVTAFAADDGSRRWTTEVEGPSGDPEYLGAPAVANGSVYVVTDGNLATYPETGTVHALDADTGDLEWRFRTKVNLRSDPAVANGTVYVAGKYEFEEEWIRERDAYEEADWRLPFSWLTAYALDAENGTERWSLMTDSSPMGTVDEVYPGSAVADSRFYATVHESGLPGTMRLTAIESADERPPWYFRAVDDREGLDDPDVQPRAVIDASPTPGEDGYYEPNAAVTLDASNSSVEYGRIVSYEWDLDDDGEFETSGRTAEVTVDDLACEETSVSLRVTDGDGDTDTTRLTLRIGPENT